MENQINNATCSSYEKIVDPHILSVVKREFNIKDRLSSKIVLDAQASKLVMDNLIPNNSNDAIKGFIQDISLDPFGFFLMSIIQVMQKILIYTILNDPNDMIIV